MKTVPDENSPRYFGWRVAGASVIGMALSPGPLFWGTLGLFVASLQADFGWDRAQIMLALTCLTIASIPAMPLIGLLVDNWGVRRVLLPSIVVLAAVLAVIPLVLSSLLTLYVLFLLAGFLTVGTQSIAYIRVLASWFDRRRGLAIGITVSGIGLGYAVLPQIIQWTIDHFSWRAGYWVLAVLVCLISLPVVTVLIRNAPSAVEKKDQTPVAGSGGLLLTEALRTREFWLITAGIFVVATVFNAMLPTMVPLLTDRGMSVAHAALAVSTMGIAMAISRVLVGYLIDFLFAPLVACAVFMLAAGGLCLLALGGVGTTAYIAAFLIGLGFGAETDLMGYMVTRYFGLRAFGQIYGVVLASFLVGTGIGPYLLGVFYELQGSYVQALGIATFLGFAAALAFLLLRPYPVSTAAVEESGDLLRDATGRELG